MKNKIKIREYAEKLSVKIKKIDKYLVKENPDSKNRLVIHAKNEGGYNCTEVDLLDVIQWVKENKPELLK